jgi:hypothetical protein
VRRKAMFGLLRAKASKRSYGMARVGGDRQLTGELSLGD